MSNLKNGVETRTRPTPVYQPESMPSVVVATSAS